MQQKFASISPPLPLSEWEAHVLPWFSEATESRLTRELHPGEKVSVRRRDKDLGGEGRAGSRWGERVPKEGTPPPSTAVRGATLGISERERFGRE